MAREIASLCTPKLLLLGRENDLKRGEGAGEGGRMNRERVLAYIRYSIEFFSLIRKHLQPRTFRSKGLLPRVTSFLHILGDEAELACDLKKNAENYISHKALLLHAIQPVTSLPWQPKSLLAWAHLGVCGLISKLGPKRSWDSGAAEPLCPGIPAPLLSHPGAEGAGRESPWRYILGGEPSRDPIVGENCRSVLLAARTWMGTALAHVDSAESSPGRKEEILKHSTATMHLIKVSCGPGSVMGV